MSDPLLALPDTALPIRPLSGPTGTLLYAGAARRRPFLLAAPGGSARGTESRALEAVEHRGRLLSGGISVAGAACGNLQLAPAQARRELFGIAGSLIETLLVGEEGMIGQWARPGPSGDELELRLVVPGSRAHCDGPFLAVGGADGVRLLQLTPAPAWRIETMESDGMIRAVARVSLDEGGARLATTWGAEPAGARDALLRLGRGTEARAESSLNALRTRRLAIHTGVEELDDGLAWAIARTEAASGENMTHALAAGEPFPADPAARRSWTALAALAAGSPGRPDVDPGTPLGALALARFACAHGARMSEAELDALELFADRPGEVALRSAHRAALLATAEAVAPWDRAQANALRARADTLAPAQSPTTLRPSSLRLPTVGPKPGPLPSQDETAADTLASVLELPSRRPYCPPEDLPPGLLRGLAAWACLNEGQVERGFTLLRAHLADGFAGGVGLWPDGGRAHDPASAALVPLVFADGLLGVRPDAHFGRLRLSPRLPGHWSRLTVTGIGVGDATVAMTYERDGGKERFRFVQEGGAVPVMLVFEPLLTARQGAPARVDGKLADLEVRVRSGEGERTELKVQLPLDREREVTVG